MNCPECRGSLVFPGGLKGEMVCERCGLVLSQDQISQGFVEWTPKWFSTWDENDSDTLREWLTRLRTISCQLNLPNFPYMEEVARVIRLKSDMFFRSQRFGKNKREAVAALIHLILRKYDQMRPLKEICETLSLDHNKVSKHVWTIRKKAFTARDFNRTFTARDYLRKYGWEVTSDTELMRSTEQLLTSIQKEISGNPRSLAAGALYFIFKKNSKIKISKEEIGKIFNISGRTVYTNERRIRDWYQQKAQF